MGPEGIMLVGLAFMVLLILGNTVFKIAGDPGRPCRTRDANTGRSAGSELPHDEPLAGTAALAFTDYTKCTCRPDACANAGRTCLRTGIRCRSKNEHCSRA